MCIAAPAHVLEINREDNWLIADFGGAKQQAKLDLLPEVEVGDYVLIHAGYAIEKLSEEAAKESLEAWEELLEIIEKEDEEMEKARMAELNQ
jgi:hydrogenase expression/formation protein HypC